MLSVSPQVCVLCGPQPSLSELERIIVKQWRAALPTLAALPRAHPATAAIDRSILGFVLVNTEKKRVLAAMTGPGAAHAHSKQHQDSPRALSLARRLDIVRTFYRTVVGAVLPSPATPSPHVVEVGGALVPDHAPHTPTRHPVSEVFSVSEYHKCLATVSGPYQLLAVFISAVPTHSMRAISQRTLQLLLKEKHNNIIK